LFMNWQKDESLPNLNKCIERAGLTGEVSHDAVDDAIDVVRVIRAATNNYSK
jgi:inhibitor of KinA sporulation pathway (predicted exonuclease)